MSEPGVLQISEQSAESVTIEATWLGMNAPGGLYLSNSVDDGPPETVKLDGWASSGGLQVQVAYASFALAPGYAAGRAWLHKRNGNPLQSLNYPAL